MKKIIPTLVFVATLLIGCGMSDQEKERIAAVTCSVMSESRNMDSSMRVKEINAAREKIGEAPYLDGDEILKTAIQYGLCQELVLNTPEVEEKISIVLEEEKKKLRQVEIAVEMTKSKVYAKSLILAVSQYFDYEDGAEEFAQPNVKRGLLLRFLCEVPEGFEFRFFVTAFGEKKMVTHKQDTCGSFHALDQISDEESKFLKEISFSSRESEVSKGTIYAFRDDDVFTYSGCDETCWDETLE